MIIDCFIFDREMSLLEFRLTELYEVVDYFVIVEAPKTFSGHTKDLFFQKNKNLYTKFLGKIIPIIDECPDSESDPWIREFFQRRSISCGIDKLHLRDSDLIIISDCDEIPDKNTLWNLKHSGINDLHHLEQDFYYYNLNCKNKNKWYNSKILNYGSYKNKYYQDCQHIREQDHTYSFDKVITNGGWHLSYFGGVDMITSKINNYAHQEYNNDKFLNLERMEDKISKGQNLFSDDETDEFEIISLEDNSYLPHNYNMIL